MTTHQLKFAPSILARLGEELLPNFDQGIIELVRNAYDADATTCKVKLSNITEAGGQIKISDNGHGMDENSISNGWLVLGSSTKRGAGTTENGRVQVGDKGLGRLAALRMGQVTKLISRPSINTPKIDIACSEYNTTLVWEEFDKKTTVDKVDIKINSVSLKSNSLSGTDIEINSLYKKITKSEIERLARSLMLLSNPFEETNDFTLTFECSEYPEFEQLVKEGYLSEAEYVIKAKLKKDGSAEAQVLDWKNTLRWKTTSFEWFRQKSENSNPIYNAPTVEFELNIFHLDSSTFATRSINKNQVSAWLKAVGGVHVYHNEFRVHPYGDSGSDWLEMNLARVNNPSIRPSTNTSIGRVNIFDEKKVLQQKTDRVGFKEDEPFKEIKRFVTDTLNWYAAERLAYAAKIKKAQKDENEIQIKEKDKALKAAIQKIPDPLVKKELTQAFKASKAASVQQTKHLKQDLKLYRSLATAGTTTAVFSHEISKPIAEIPESLSSAERLIKINSEPSIYERYKERTSNILGYLNRLSHFAELQLDLLKRSKRRNEAIEVVPVMANLLKSFKPLLDREHIVVKFDSANAKDSKLQGSICILEAIITNCLTNSIRAFRKENFDVETRTIEVYATQQAKDSLLIRFSDNGPGITELSARDIWLPGVTTIDNGTGFGLTIVKDSVSDLGGSCRVDTQGHLGGATFYFEFVTI